jgi:hypothetical protein
MGHRSSTVPWILKPSVVCAGFAHAQIVAVKVLGPTASAAAQRFQPRRR